MGPTLRFSWDKPSLSGPRLQAYASLLRIQTDGQVDERPEPGYATTDGDGEDHVDGDGDSVAARPLASFNATRLREAFQDWVSELVANVKGGQHVAGTMFVNTAQGLTLVVAKNNGIEGRDRRFLAMLQERLREVSRTQAGFDAGTRDALWEDILQHCNSRISEWIAQFCADTASFAQTNAGSEECELSIQMLRSAVRAVYDAASAEEPQSVIVDTAHVIWKTWGEENFVAAFPSHQDSGRKIWVNVGFLGRLRTACSVLIRAMERLDELGDIIIHPLTWPRRRNRKKWDEANKTWTLGETFQSLGIPYTNAAVKDMCGATWTRHKLIKKFDEIQRQALQVHVEMQLLLYGTRIQPAEANPSSYIGCSKRSCFPCWEFLGTHGGFRTRATHGKIYHMWGIPRVEDVPEPLQALIVRTLNSVEESVLVQLRMKTENGLRLAKESTVGGSSIETRVGFRDYLLRAVLEDEIPDDPQTMDDYGFSRCRIWSEKSHLLGLYGGMLKCDVSSEQMDDWKRSGTLVDNIVSYYMAIPEDCRGGYFPWFQRHTFFLEDSHEEDPDESQGDMVIVTAISKAMVFLHQEDQKTFSRLEPIEKLHSFLFLAIARESMHPIPTDDLWYNFGFCTCRDEHEERRLGGLYAKLVSGNKFWKDYEMSLGMKIPGPPDAPAANFERYGLFQDRIRCPQLESFLREPAGARRPPVWGLRRYFEFEGVHVDVPADVLRAAHAYGISSDLSIRERMQMVAFYKQLWQTFGWNPLEMEEARRRGTLVEHGQSYLQNVEQDVVRQLEKLKQPQENVPGLIMDPLE
ncbi:hypothetical protein BCR34DRAFT_607900 [Clohesyomyces aquaticus]|uniref:Uncharacterized protein n=1 Tax=Clohesyomyces aquaticus TaxID=1231657 RepID=A0A1Y1YCE8_9PLEO|nr:hypothetical protein BCR34DRAFT_607900 [Clohesyomyces aquaticus]